MGNNALKKLKEDIEQDIRRDWWLISVRGYGSFGFYGTELEAEEMRAHKASWERGVGCKEQITSTHKKAKEAVALLKWEQELGYGLDEREIAAINDIQLIMTYYE